MEFDAFISHSSEDSDLALKLCQALERAKAKCWIAPRDIVPGMSWRESITKAMKDSGALILLISASSNVSGEVKKEVALAGANKLTLIPVRIEDVEPAEEFEYEMAGRHWLDMLGRSEGDFDHAVNNILYALPKADVSLSIKPEPKPEEPPRKGKPWMVELLRIVGLIVAFLGILAGLYIFQSGANPWYTLIPPGIGSGLGFWFFLKAWQYSPDQDEDETGPKLKCIGGMLDGKCFTVTDLVSAGRAIDNDIVIPESTVSHRHAVFEPQKDGLVVRDLRSTNGTYVNGKRLEPEVKVWLENGDEVKLSKDCQVAFKVEIP